MPLRFAIPSALAVALLSGCISPPKPPVVSAGERIRSARVQTGPFAWGISTSSYQYEDPDVTIGAPDYFYSDWDIFVSEGKAPPKGNALYSWSHWEKDLEALKKIGVTHYRFSLSWPRIEPKPGEYNEAAIQGYARMARDLKRAGIEPVVCLWHFTFPSWLYDRKHPSESNWLHPNANARWEAYVHKVVPALAPYVRFFAPQNEPNGQLSTAYLGGEWPPGEILNEPVYDRAVKASIRQFREAAAIIKEIKPSAIVMSVQALPWWKRSILDPTQAFYNGMQRVNLEQLDGIYDVCDIIGFNYYYSNLASPISYFTAGTHHGPNFTMMGWDIDPKGLYLQIKLVGDRYGKPMMITENGIATRKDPKRIRYITEHLAAIQRARAEGYDVRGYFYWSLADNYEWHYGYTALFGLSHMDPRTLDRVLKPSAEFYRAIIADDKKGPDCKQARATIPGR